MTSLLAPLALDAQAPLARRNPVAKLGAAAVVMLVLLVTVDPVTPAVLLAATLAAVPLSGVSAGALLRRSWPLLLAVATLALANAVFTDRKGGSVLLHAGPLLVTTESLGAGGTAGLRVLAIALPGILAVATIDPVDLADALVQQLRVPARFAYGALAALRLAPLLGEDWQTIARARRARGVDAGRNPVRAVALLSSQVLGLLVVSIRRAVRLAMAMDARGFSSGRSRTFAREQRMVAADWGLLGSAVVVAGAATAGSVAAGSWRFLLG